MKKKILFVLIAIPVVCGVLLSLLMKLSDKSNTALHGFKRQWFISKTSLLHESSAATSLSRISGASSGRLFFTGKSDPRLLFATDNTLTRWDTLGLRLPLNPEIMAAYILEVDSPEVSFYAGNLGAVFTCSLDTTNHLTMGKRMNSVPMFTRVGQISSETVVFRGFDTTRQKQFFMKVHKRTGETLAQADIIPDQTDMGFSTDGMLEYDRESQRLLYVQYYQNRFYCMDTSLALLYTGRTIDTTFTNPIYTRNTTSGKTEGNLMPAVPLKPVNEAACVGKGRLFILSALQADNENNNAFLDNTVVDVYRINDGSYAGSFYIPNHNGKKASAIRFLNNNLVVLYPQHVATYKLDKELFTN